MKKIAFLLATLLLLGSLLTVFSSCNKEPEKKPEESREKIDNDDNGLGYVADSLPENDFGGEVVTILTSDWRETPKYILSTEYNGEPVNDVMVDAYYTVCNRFNLDIELNVGGDQKVVAATVDNLALSQDQSYDIVYNHDTRTVGNAVNGAFLNIKSMDLVDLENPWWTRSSQDFQISDRLYFTSSYLGLWAPYMNIGLYYNKQFAEDHSITIPYDDIIAGEWYMEDMIILIENLKSDYDGDGDIDLENQYGFVTSYFGNLSAQANLGGAFMSRDENGNIKIDKKIDRFSSYMSLMERLYANGTDDATNGNATYNIGIFKKGHSLLWYGETRVLLEARNEISFKWGMIPFPKYDENQKEYSSAGYDLYWGVNKNVADRSEIVATVIEALSCQNYNYTIPTIWEDFLGLRLAEALIDQKMVAIVRDASYVNPDYAYAAQVIGMSDLLNLWETSDVNSVSSHINGKAILVETAMKLFASKFEKLPA
ncbi:MAG: hypothetical protein J6B71_03245 [Clostridia bacterium]|nr:hypothetical protein [Clostridia bacterium]